MKDSLTIVIPSKNEREILYECLSHIESQNSVRGTNVIVADCSDDDESLEWIKKAKKDFFKIKLNFIPGGYPAEARLKGSKLVKTPYVLFLDSDVMLTDQRTLEKVINSDFDLLTLRMKTDKGWNWVYRGFDFFQSISKMLGTPFAIGGFQLWKTDIYWKCGGYDPMDLFAEDYALSKKVSPKRFTVMSGMRVWTSARRFRNKGVLWMFSIMIRSYFNRNNPEFFRNHHGYWQ
jgi:glycosyltransferase involved in cell wall biosynthesis